MPDTQTITVTCPACHASYQKTIPVRATGKGTVELFCHDPNCEYFRKAITTYES